MEHWLKRAWAEIDLNALEQNYNAIRAAVAPSTRIMSIVKADGYGHGAVAVARTLAAAGSDWFAVSNAEEALQLRRAGITQPILILSYTPPEEVPMLIEQHITQTVVSAEHAAELNAAAAAAGGVLEVHIKLDTGMSRVGFFCQDGLSALDEVADACLLPHLRADGIFTHFAVSDEPQSDDFTRTQFARFTAMLDALAARGITFSLRHCCNSAATVRFPEMQLDMVRPGLILYGMYPDDCVRSLLPLTPVMSLRARVSLVKTLPCAATVSYGRQYEACAGTRLATVPIGYADGYTRRASNKAQMLLHGKRVPVRGRICMDQCMVEVAPTEEVKAGDLVTAFGQDGSETLPIEEYAALSDTINYEIVCAISKRVPRLFLQNGAIVSLQDNLL